MREESLRGGPGSAKVLRQVEEVHRVGSRVRGDRKLDVEIMGDPIEQGA